MKICYIVPRYLPAPLTGSEVYISNLAQGLRKLGHQTVVLTTNVASGRNFFIPTFRKLKKEEKISGVLVKRLPTATFRNSFFYLLNKFFKNAYFQIHSQAPYLNGLEEQIKKIKPDLVHASPFPLISTWQAGKICQKLKIPFICTPFTHYKLPIYQNPHLKQVLKISDLVITQTKFEKKLLESWQADSQKVKVLPLGIFNLKEKPSAESFLNKYKLHSKKVIIFLGTKSFEKGAVTLLEATDFLHHKIQNLILVAAGFQTLAWQNAKKLFPKAPLLDLDYLKGDDKFSALAASQVLAMPSKADALGIVYLEAWQQRKPIIAADIGPMLELFSQGGLLVPFGKPKELARAIEQILKNPKLARKLGQKGYQKYYQHFRWETLFSQFEKLYQEVLKKPS